MKKFHLFIVTAAKYGHFDCIHQRLTSNNSFKEKMDRNPWTFLYLAFICIIFLRFLLSHFFSINCPAVANSKECAKDAELKRGREYEKNMKMEYNHI